MDKDNTIALFYNGKAIILNEWGELFYCSEADEAYIGIGEFIDEKYIHPISELPDSEQEAIQKIFSNVKPI